ncbi:hypothetical protein AAVH_10847 [Aphelenchoides avenae]|nr:hypothetical protein AAVH_10847 [Aphelenchus avenae]
MSMHDTIGRTAFIEWEDWQVLKDLHIIELVDKWKKAFDASEENRKALREAFDGLMNSCDRLYSRITMYPDQACYILMHGANAAELKRGLELHHDTVNQRDVEVLDVDCDEELLHDEAPTTVYTVAMPATSQARHNTATGSKELAGRTMKETTPDAGHKRSSFWSYFAKDFEDVDEQRTATLIASTAMAEHAQKCTKIVEELGSAGKAKISLCRT